MARTTSAAVQALMLPGQDYDTLANPSLTPFIDTASALVDDVVTCAAADGVTLTAARLELIERWLAAHCYCMSDQTYASKNTEGAGASFHGQTGMHLEASKYGQMAARLDSSGCLESIAGAERKVASGFWLGKAPSGQTPYRSRD